MEGPPVNSCLGPQEILESPLSIPINRRGLHSEVMLFLPTLFALVCQENHRKLTLLWILSAS